MVKPSPLPRSFWVIWAGGTFSFLGEGLLFGAIPLLAASLTRDPRLVSLTEAASQAGWLLLGLISGVFVDRWRRTTVMWRADALRALVAVGFAVVVLAGMASVAVVLLAGLLLGLIAPFFDNASAAVVPQLVKVDQLERANSLMQTSMMLSANLIGPPLAAALFVLTPSLPFVLQAVALAIGACLVYTARKAAPAPPSDGHRHLRRELREGLAFLWRSRLLRAFAVLLMLVNGASAAIVAVLVLYVLDVLRLPEVAYGWLIATYAVGGLLGAVIAPRVASLGVAVSSIGSSIVTGLAIVGLGAWPNVVFVVICVLVAGVGSVVWNVVTLSVRQRLVPIELMGRVTSVYRVVGFAAMPAGAALAGLAAHGLGLQAPYIIAGLLIVVAALLAIPAIRSNAKPA